MENTELHSTLVYIEEKEFMSDLYPEGLPTNTIIDKTLTAKGATTCELEAKRNSIIVEPNVPVIVGKQNKYPKALGVCEGVTDATIKTYLLDKSIPHKKIIVTPESYSKVKRAADYASINLFKDFFLLIDECEKVVQDAEFRPNIILPFFDFFSFDNKALISATPLLPNLKGFTNHSFTCIKIIPNYDYKKALNLVGTNNVQQEFMNQIFQSGNKIAIFLNSPEYAKALIEKANIRDCTKIYCSDTDGNIGKLRKEGYKAADLFVSGEVLEQYSFFTSRFYSAVDLETSDRPDIIMMTDCISRPHTMIDPYTHAIQIVGRFRNGVNYITHITNTFTDYTYRSKEEVLREVEIYEINYNFIRRELGNAIDNGSQCAFRTLLKTSPFNQFLDRHNNKSYCAVDNYVDEVMVRNMYLSEDTLFTTYTDEVLMKYFSAFRASYLYKAGNIEWLQLRNANKSIVSKRKVIVDILEKILPYETESDYEFRKDIYKSDPLIVEAVEILGIEEVRRLRYITNALKLEIYKAKCQSPQVTELIHDYFKVGGRYLLTDIKTTIKRIYEECGIAPQERVTAQTLRNYFNCDRATPKGKEGLLIVSVLN